MIDDLDIIKSHNQNSVIVRNAFPRWNCPEQFTTKPVGRVGELERTAICDIGVNELLSTDSVTSAWLVVPPERQWSWHYSILVGWCTTNRTLVQGGEAPGLEQNIYAF